MNDNSTLGNKWSSLFDWPLFLLALSISLLGVFVIYSANFASDSASFRGLYLKQLEWNIYGIIVMAGIAMMDYRIWERPAYLFYFLAIGSLIAVLVSGRVIAGSQRWLGVGSLNVQPSEMMKLVLIMTLTKYFNYARELSEELGFKQLFIPAILTLIPALLIAKQPDLGTASVLCVIFLIMAFINGIRKNALIAIIIGMMVLVPVGWFNLKDYQKNRVLAMIDPTTDPLGIGYHTIQSKIAIGSGGFLGKGFFAGTQSKLNFLPEKHTDFIFAVYAEEVGFLGVFVLLVLFVSLVLRMMDLIINSKDRIGSLLAAGITGMIAFHFLYNVSMTIGITPIVGIPLPLFSYGGSALLTNYAAIGILISIRMRRFRHD